jgi:hypothetical protein
MRTEFQAIFKSADLSDVTVTLAEGTNLTRIPAHKVMISRSRKISKLLEEEPNLNEIHVLDLRLPVFMCLLEYIYTDSMKSCAKLLALPEKDAKTRDKKEEESIAFAVELIEACTKYGLPELQQCLEDALLVGTTAFTRLPKRLGNHLDNFWNRSDLSDVSFQMGDGSKIPAHKVAVKLAMSDILVYPVCSFRSLQRNLSGCLQRK